MNIEGIDNKLRRAGNVECTGETMFDHGAQLCRIRAIKSLGTVASGTVGGWVQSADNIKAYGNEWIGGAAIVRDNATVMNNARVTGSCRICENATICDNASIEGAVVVKGRTTIGGKAIIKGAFTVPEGAYICGDALIHNEDQVCLAILGGVSFTVFRTSHGIHVTINNLHAFPYQDKNAIRKGIAENRIQLPEDAVIAVINAMAATIDNRAPRKNMGFMHLFN